MTWDNSPWAIEDGQTSADVGRLVAWHAVDGLTGVGAPTDLLVRALDVPGSQVRVMPGTCTVPVKALGKSYQVYIGSNPTEDTISIPASGSSGTVSHLIVARVENPINGEPWQPPEDPITGQYIHTRRYSTGVTTSTTHVAQVDPAASALTLARIDVPANTGTITQAMITDLRKTAQQEAPLPEDSTFTDTMVFTSTSTLSPPSNSAGHQESGWVNWPSLATWNVKVPSRATSMQLFYMVNPAISANTWGELRFLVNGSGTAPIPFDENFPKVSESGANIVYNSNAGGMRTQYLVGAVRTVSPSERGTTIAVRVQGRTFSNQNAYLARGSSAVTSGSVGRLEVVFKQAASSS